MDYCLWLDADDVLLEDDQEKFRVLKEGLDPHHMAASFAQI